MLYHANLSAWLMRRHGQTTRGVHETLIAQERRVLRLLVLPGRLYGSSQAKAWPSSPALKQRTALHVVHRDTGGTQVGHRLHDATKTNSFHVIFWGVPPQVGVGMFALQMIICVFNFAFSPSVGMLLFSLGSSSPIHI